ncbi:MAG: hypothetical protein RLZZ11_1374 [Cyanobacteriota bacterium]|jgi:hypothetical protein
MNKPLNKLVPDLRRALSEATTEVAHDVTLELKLRGPYWDGLFEGAWVIRKGQVNIDATRKGADPSSDEAQPREITAPVVPQIGKMNLDGFTIGNQMEYRDIATDLEPGRIKNEKSGGTAEQDWFERYLDGGELTRDIGAATTRAMRAHGF